MKRRCAITGASGYLGSRLASHLESEGWQVRSLVRREDRTGRETVPFHLGEAVAPEALVGTDTLIHAAYDFAPRSWAEIERVNVVGAQHLFAAAEKAGLRRIVLISSLSAFARCRSLYGRAKLAIEQACRERGGIVIRPGLIHGENAGGIVGRMKKAVEARAIVPVLTGGRRLFLAHEHDVCQLVSDLLDSSEPPAIPIVAAARTPLSLAEIVRRLATRSGRRVWSVPCPWPLAWAGLRVLEATRRPSTFRSDSVLSFATLEEAPDFAGLDRIRTPFREF
jgi:nucleoside-diphosphate-sugar epimerase